MDVSSLQQYGIAAIFIVAAYRFYTDMRADSAKREEKLMEHLGKQAITMAEISDTLKTMDSRVCNLEEYCRNKKDGE